MLEQYRLMMAVPMPSRLHVWSPIGKMFAAPMAQSMRTPGVHPGHLAPTGPNADRAVNESRNALSATFMGDASTATDFSAYLSNIRQLVWTELGAVVLYHLSQSLYIQFEKIAAQL
eukprot:2632544-Amphidinium_carterae.1